MENEEITQQQTASQPPGPQSYTFIDYLNSIYVDYRSLIPKGLALEAPEGMYKKDNNENINKTS